jgi:hypothetical protein
LENRKGKKKGKEAEELGANVGLMRKDNRKKICERVDGCGLVGVFYM